MVVVATGGNYNSQSPADKIIAKFILAGYNAQNFKTNQSKWALSRSKIRSALYYTKTKGQSSFVLLP